MLRTGLPWAGLAAVAVAVVATVEARSFLATYDAAGLVGGRFGEQVAGALGPVAVGLAALVSVGAHMARFLASPQRDSSLHREIFFALGASVVLATVVGLVSVAVGAILVSQWLGVDAGMYVDSLLDNTPHDAVARGLARVGAFLLVVAAASAIAARRVRAAQSTTRPELLAIVVGAPAVVGVHLALTAL